MAIIVLASASGSPGVTTTALGLALVWPRPVVLVDADPVGGSALLAGYFRGNVASTDSMVTLALAHRDGGLDAALPGALVTVPNSQVRILPGARSHAQAASLTGLWEPLALGLRALELNGQDVIVDVGRLGMASSPTALISAADVALLVIRSDLPALSAARQWAIGWTLAAHDGTGATSVAALLVGEGRPYRSGEVAKVLRLPVLAEVARDERSAAVLSQGEQPRRNFDSSPLVGSLRTAASAIDQAIATSRLQAAARQEVSIG